MGKLKNKKPGFQIMALSTPYHGRAIPFSFISYSSKTIGDHLSSRNMEHGKAIGELKELLGNKVLVLDREFSYLGFVKITKEKGCKSRYNKAKSI